jgi:hypothetical protein
MKALRLMLVCCSPGIRSRKSAARRGEKRMAERIIVGST